MLYVALTHTVTQFLVEFLEFGGRVIGHCRKEGIIHQHGHATCKTNKDKGGGGYLLYTQSKAEYKAYP